MNKTLFQIEQSMYNLLNYGIDDETGEVIQSEEEFDKLYDSIQVDINTKLDNTNCLCKILDGELEVIDKEIERLQKQKKARENTKKFLKNRVDFFIRKQYIDENGNLDGEGLNKFKLELPHSKISYRKSENVNVLNTNDVPEEYLKIKTETTIDKQKIKDVLKSGKEVSGCELVTNYNMQVK